MSAALSPVVDAVYEKEASSPCEGDGDWKAPKDTPFLDAEEVKVVEEGLDPTKRGQSIEVSSLPGAKRRKCFRLRRE